MARADGQSSAKRNGCQGAREGGQQNPAYRRTLHFSLVDPSWRLSFAIVLTHSIDKFKDVAAVTVGFGHCFPFS